MGCWSLSRLRLGQFRVHSGHLQSFSNLFHNQFKHVIFLQTAVSSYILKTVLIVLITLAAGLFLQKTWHPQTTIFTQTRLPAQKVKKKNISSCNEFFWCKYWILFIYLVYSNKAKTCRNVFYFWFTLLEKASTTSTKLFHLQKNMRLQFCPNSLVCSHHLTSLYSPHRTNVSMATS